MPMTYDELEVEISRCLCGKPEVRVLTSPFDRPREPFERPFDLTELNARLEELDGLLLKTDDQAATRRKELAEGIGQDLYRALFPGKLSATIGNCLASLDAFRSDGKDVGLRIRFSFGESERHEPSVIGLPLELICNPITKLFPNKAPQTPVVRYLDLPKRIAPLATLPPIRILSIISAPRDLPSFDVNEQRKILSEASSGTRMLKLKVLKNPTCEALRRKLNRSKDEGKPFHGLHFVGHGGFGNDGEGVLYFENDHRQKSPITGRELADQLSGFNELRLATLATCKGAQMIRKNGQHPFSGVASALIALGFSAAVAMQFPISVRAATVFISSFYKKLAKGKTVDEAVTEGRQAIAASETGSFEWATPVLFLRAKDGRILDIHQEPSHATKKTSDGEPRRTRPQTYVETGNIRSGKSTSIIGSKNTTSDGQKSDSVVKAGNIKAMNDVSVVGTENKSNN